MYTFNIEVLRGPQQGKQFEINHPYEILTWASDIREHLSAAGIPNIEDMTVTHPLTNVSVVTGFIGNRAIIVYVERQN